jgi:hypothetical protein
MLDFATIIFYTTRLSALRLTPNVEDQVPVFMSPSNRVTQLYPQAPGSRFVAFSDCQGYGWGTTTRLHTGRVTDILLQILDVPVLVSPAAFSLFSQFFQSLLV